MAPRDAGREYNTIDMSRAAASQRLPAAVQGGGRRGRGDRDERLQLAQRRAGQREPLPAAARSCARSGVSAAPSSATTRRSRSSIDFGFATNGADAARLALTAGVDIEMGVQVPEPVRHVHATTGRPGASPARSAMTQINSDVRHVLTLKFLAGMFDHPLTDPHRVDARRAHPGEPGRRADHGRPLDGPAQRPEQRAAAEHRRAVDRRRRPACRQPVRPARPRRAHRLRPSTRQGRVSVLDGIKAAAAERDRHVRAGLRHRVHVDVGVRRRGERRQGRGVTVVVVGEPAADSRRGVLAQRHQPARPAARARAGDRRDRQALRRGADERPPADARLARRQRARRCSSPGTRHRGRRCRGRRPVRQGRPGRQAADELPAQRRADPASPTTSCPPAGRPTRTTSTRPSTSTCRTRRSTRSGTACPTPRSRCRTCTCRASSVPATGKLPSPRTSPTPEPGPAMMSPSSTSTTGRRASCSPSAGSTASSGSRSTRARNKTVTFTLGPQNLASTTTRDSSPSSPARSTSTSATAPSGGLHGQFTVAA